MKVSDLLIIDNEARLERELNISERQVKEKLQERDEEIRKIKEEVKNIDDVLSKLLEKVESLENDVKQERKRWMGMALS